MAGRTRRSGRSNEPQSDTQVEATEVEDGTSEDEATPEDHQEAANEAPETSQEADVSATTEEAPVQDEAQADEAQTTETEAAAPAEATAPKTPEELYAEFQSIVTGAVERSDKTTGTVPEADMSSVLTSYKALGSTGRNSKSDAKTWIADIMRETLVKGDMPGATALANINKAVNEASSRRTSTAAPKPTVSPTQAYVERYVAQALAGQFIPVPEGLEETWHAQYNEVLDREGKKVDEYKAWLAKPEDERGDEPEGISAILKDAAKIGQGRAVGRRASGPRKSGGGGATGSRRDVRKHIEEFLDSVEVGTDHAVSAIANFKSSEYPEGDASPGAVAARLFPTGGKPSTIQGFEQLTGEGARKIRKLAA